MLYPKVACCPKAMDYFEVANLTEALGPGADEGAHHRPHRRDAVKCT